MLLYNVLVLCKAATHLHHEGEVHILALRRCAPCLLIPTARDDINPLQSSYLSNVSLSACISRFLASISVAKQRHFRSHHGGRILTGAENREKADKTLRREFVLWSRRRSGGQERSLVEAPPPIICGGAGVSDVQWRLEREELSISMPGSLFQVLAAQM